jgi:hypothetical protein
MVPWSACWAAGCARGPGESGTLVLCVGLRGWLGGLGE